MIRELVTLKQFESLAGEVDILQISLLNNPLNKPNPPQSVRSFFTNHARICCLKQPRTFSSSEVLPKLN